MVETDVVHNSLFYGSFTTQEPPGVFTSEENNAVEIKLFRRQAEGCPDEMTILVVNRSKEQKECVD